MGRIILILVALLSVVMLPSSGFCQTNDEGLAFLQLNFLNPGARAISMGGAFVAMADDATAALANPAGLTTLIKPEMTLEFSATRYRNEIPWTSGYYVARDPINGFSDYDFHYEPQDFPSTTSSISFASFVYPVIKNQFVVSGFYNEPTRFERNFLTHGFDECYTDGSCSIGEWTGTRNSLNFRIKNIGFSSGFKPLETLSLGATVNVSNLTVASRTDRICNTLHFIYCDPPEPGVIEQSFLLTADDNRFGYTVGALIKPLKRFSAGFVYSNRPAFHVTVGRSWPLLIQDQERPESLHIPDSFAFGFSLKPNDRLSFNLDIARIRYSQLMDGYYNAYFIFTQVPAGILDFEGFKQKRAGGSIREVADGTEYRLGAEYILFFGRVPFAIRGGYWREPFHGMTVNYDEDHIPESLGFPGWPFDSRSFIQNYNHVTFGTGVVLKTFTVDWAYDHSKNFKRFILSSVFYLDWLTRN